MGSDNQTQIDEKELRRPLDAVEKARLVTVCRDWLTASGMLVLRRLLFQSDMAPRVEEALRKQVEQLQAVIDKHNLCHDLHGQVGQVEFEEGCRLETIKVFGSCQWAERLAAFNEAAAAEAGRETVRNNLRPLTTDEAFEAMKARTAFGKDKKTIWAVSSYGIGVSGYTALVDYTHAVSDFGIGVLD